MIDEKLLREHLNSYALNLERDTYEEFHDILYASEKGKLSSRKRNIYVTVEKTDYPFNGMRVVIKAKIDQVPCLLSFSFNYDKFKRGIDLYFTYNLVELQPYIMPFSVRGDELNLSYNTAIPFMVWMSDEEKYATYYCRENYKAIINKDKEKLETIKSLYGEEYITNLKKYFGKPEKRYLTVIEARVAATKMIDRFIDFMTETAWEETEE